MTLVVALAVAAVFIIAVCLAYPLVETWLWKRRRKRRGGYLP